MHIQVYDVCFPDPQSLAAHLKAPSWCSDPTNDSTRRLKSRWSKKTWTLDDNLRVEGYVSNSELKYAEALHKNVSLK